MTLFEILTLRSTWEELVKDYKIDDEFKYGTISNLEHFISNGMKGNRFRSGFEEATRIAKTIVDYYGSMEPLGRKLAR